MPWETLLVDEAVQEISSLEGREREALENAMKKLQALGPQLGYPHSSAVRGAQDLRELRPRAGRSPWRAFYRRIGDAFVIGAIGPEAAVDRRGSTGQWLPPRRGWTKWRWTDGQAVGSQEHR